MTMKTEIYILFSLLSIFLASVSSETTTDFVNNFLHCLEENCKTSSSSSPINQVIYTPDNPSFLNVFHSYARSSRILASGAPKPLAIVAAAEESHVQATVICAKSNGLQIRIRSGGHDYEGLSYVSDVLFVILDMFNLRSIDVNITDETAWVQSGATVGELYYAIAQKSKVHAFPAGVAPSLGVGGHFTGGGYGNLIRKYGLSVDNVLDAHIVDVHGKILTRESMGEDLFWAIRGGGGASFGVILSWKIKLVSVPENVTVFKVIRTLEEGATEIMDQYQQVATKLPTELFIRAQPIANNGTFHITFYGEFLGTQETLIPLMNTQFPKLGLNQSDCIGMSWVESTLFWPSYPVGTPIEALLNRTLTLGPFKSKSDYVKTPVSKANLDLIWKMMLQVQEQSTILMQWNPYGGRMSEISESETPFPHRNGNLFKVQYWISWKEGGDQEESSKKYMEVIRNFYEAMAPYVSKNPREAFLNYRDLDIGSNPSNFTRYEDAVKYGAKLFKGNFERLVKVKTMVDPSNFFKNEQSIPPSS